MAACHHLFSLLRTSLAHLANQPRKKCALNLISSRTLSLSCLSLDASKTQGLLNEKVYDVAIVGGGIMGSSSAYFLANRMPPGMGKICVIERDPTYSRASTVLSIAGIRQQFSIAENIQMSRSSFQFLSDIGQILAVEGCDPPDIQLQRCGYMFLASKEGEEIIRQNHALQSELGCQVILLTVDELSKRYPWLNTDGVALASLGTGNEGHFDPWSLLNAFKRKAVSLGVDYINGEAVNFVTDQNGQINSVKVHKWLVECTCSNLSKAQLKLP